MKGHSLRLGGRSVRRAVLAAAMATAGVSIAATPAALAHSTTCRTDPQMFLSNGYKFEMDASVPVSASDIQEVDYALNAPSGAVINSVTWTANQPFPETLSYQATNSRNHYNSTTTVYLKDGSVVTVTANNSVTNRATDGSVLATNTGPANKPVPVSVTSN